jgi:L-cystine transport system substrate-binding protein
MSRWKKILAVALGVLFTVGLLGCGDEKSSDAKTDEVKVYKVATRGTFKPFTYFDDNNNLTGYDIEILKEVEKRNPNIKFEFNTMSIESAFVALEAKEIDLIANQMSRNPDREKKYGFTNEVNNYTCTKITVRGDRDDINSLEDLRGKKLIVTPTGEAARLAKEFSEKGEPKIEFSYTDKGSAETLNVIATGRADAGVEYEVAVHEAVKALGLNLKTTGPVILSVPTYYISRKDDDAQALLATLDKTIGEMRKDGSLKALSEKFLGADYTHELDK